MIVEFIHNLYTLYTIDPSHTKLHSYRHGADFIYRFVPNTKNCAKVGVEHLVC